MGHQKKQRSYVLTPSRKHLGKYVARGSRYSIALHCWKDEGMRQHSVKAMGMVLRGEITALCSDKANSLLTCQSAEALACFCWDDLESEIKIHAPTLTSLLHSCFKTRLPRQNLQQMICLCTALMCKHRRSSMSLLHKVISLILYSGHCSKQV